MKYGTKKMQRRATEIVNSMVLKVSRLLLAEVNCVFHLTILFCTASVQYFQSLFESYMLTRRFKSSCYCKMYWQSVIITVDTKTAMIYTRSMKLCL